jgi:hypothetical protein
VSRDARDRIELHTRKTRTVVMCRGLVPDNALEAAGAVVHYKSGVRTGLA